MGEKMKEVLYKKRHSQKKHRKFISIREISEDKECRTLVRKSFIYKVHECPATIDSDEAPQINIKKEIDNKSFREKFSFRVKGVFYLNQGRYSYRVEFCHALKIIIDWKAGIFSPKKSETLT
jgi:hypothetical protein